MVVSSELSTLTFNRYTAMERRKKRRPRTQFDGKTRKTYARTRGHHRRRSDYQPGLIPAIISSIIRGGIEALVRVIMRDLL